MKYSPSRNAFFPESLEPTYKNSGTLPDDLVKITESEWQTYGASHPPAGMQRSADENGRPIWIAAPKTPLKDLATRQRAAIATALADALAGGMPHTMPDGTEDTVQMLAEDRQNLLGMAIEARDLKTAGETGAVQEFRGLSNSRYPMTPDQVISLTDAALAHYKSLLQRSWDRKDAIDSALDAGDREAIEAVIW